jgi:RHS repeat-associated protein
VTFDTKMGSATVLQQDDYYPFGYEISRGTITSPKNEYLYNKKELQEELQQYDYGARFYDPVIGRWTTVDPLVEEDQESTTPYGYVFNDPIRFVDPDGRVPEDGPGPAVKILVGGLAISGSMVAAPTVVGEVIALPAVAVTATGTLLVAGGVAIWSTLFHHHKVLNRRRPHY